MILRSGSTPILSSVLPTRTECTIQSGCLSSPKHPTLTSPKKYTPKKKIVSFHQTGPMNPITPTSSCIINTSPSRIGRAQSEGNLGGLLSGACNSSDGVNSPTQTHKYPRKPHCPVLQPIPAFSEDGRDEQHEEEEDIGDCLSIEMAYMKSKGFGNSASVENECVPSKMDLARGLGSATLPAGLDGGTGGGNKKKRFGGGGGANWWIDMKEHYKKMVEENPGNPLFLSNYAQFLHQSEDLGGAEEYYSRAILSEPSDSQILSGYARVIWELHRDEERASSYYQRALQTAPTDSQVLAGYASFLWETKSTENCKSVTSKSLVSEKKGLQILI